MVVAIIMLVGSLCFFWISLCLASQVKRGELKLRRVDHALFLIMSVCFLVSPSESILTAETMGAKEVVLSVTVVAWLAVIGIDLMVMMWQIRHRGFPKDGSA